MLAVFSQKSNQNFILNDNDFGRGEPNREAFYRTPHHIELALMTRKNIFALSCRLRDTTSTRILHSTSHFAEIGDRDNKKDGMLPSLQKKVRVLRNRCNRLTRPFLKNNEAFEDRLERAFF